MARLKLTQPGFTTLTGALHNISFVNGVSGDLTDAQINRIAANVTAVIVASDGVTVIGPAGEAAGVKSLGRVAQAATPFSPNGDTPGATIVALTQAQYNALPVKDPKTYYAILAGA